MCIPDDDEDAPCMLCGEPGCHADCWNEEDPDDPRHDPNDNFDPGIPKPGM